MLPLIKLITTFISIFALCSISKKIKYFIFFSFLLLISLYGNVLFIIFNHSFLTTAVIDSIIETNSNELKLMFFQYYKIVFLSVFLSILSLFFYIRYISNYINLLILKFSWIILFLYLFFVIFHSFYSVYASTSNAKTDFYKVEQSFNEMMKGPLFYDIHRKMAYPFSDIIYISSYFLSNDGYHALESEKKLDENIVKLSDSKINLIVFIMGESSWKKRYSIYGYDKITTPNMSFIFNQEGACVLPAYSVATITRDSIPISFSFSHPNNYKPLTEKKSVIEIAKMQGYKTYWIGAQEVEGVFSSKYGYLTKSVDELFISIGRDDDLDGILQKSLRDNDEKKFIIIHMQGSHTPYTNFNELDKKELKDVSDYDLTIYHTDKNIKKIYNSLQSLGVDFTLIYTSDHGELINKGHGFINGKEQIEIPLLVYSNNKYNACDKFLSLKNKNNYISALSNKIILLDMMGVSLDNSFIQSEVNNTSMKRGDGEIINYMDFY